MKRKGFTLIELLAVIVILAVIALITTTIITKVVENSRKNAAKNSALNYLDAVEKYVMYHDVDDAKYPYDLKDNTWNITETSTKEISLLNLIPSVKAEEVEVPPLNDFIKVSGNKPTSGIVTIDNKGKIANAIMIINNYNVTCDSSSNCSVEGKDTDPIPVLTIDEENIKATETKITIPYTVEIEKGSTTIECIYGTNENYGQTGVINEENNTCTLSNLTKGTTYYFKLTPTSDKNKNGETKTGNKTTLNYVHSTEFKVGDYIKMTPSYEGEYTPTTDSSSPYYTGTNTPGSVTPSELDTWVVIKKNDDGTIEMVSLNVSSTQIMLYGSTGYNNSIGALKKISEQYENSSFCSGSRFVGYVSSSSIEQCTLCGDNSDYLTDINLIKNAMKIKNIETASSTTPLGQVTNYWISTRRTPVGDCQYAIAEWDSGRDAWTNETIYSSCNYPGWPAGNYSRSASIRPILTLKPDVIALSSGDGSSEHPWVLVEQ